jgi:anti-sigma regulatory factor (Ser/Thr protein kinase)
MSAALARRARFAVPAAAESVALTRDLVGTVLRAWRSHVDPQAAKLLVSELITNAYQHAISGATRETDLIEVEVAETFDGVHIEVHDSDQSSRSKVTANRHAPAHAEGGRGLMLVNALADQWGAMKTERGKCVYFDLRAAAAAQTTVTAQPGTRSSDGGATCAVDGTSRP